MPFTGIHEKVPELSVNDDGECILAKEEMSIDRTDCAVNIIVDSAEEYILLCPEGLLLLPLK